MNTKILTPIICMIFLLSTGLVSALNVDSEYITIYSGQEGSITLEIENTLDEDLEDVSVRLILDELPFTSVGSAEDTDDIDEGDDEKFTFTLKASTDIAPGDYNIPYEVNYEYDGDDEKQEGSFGLRVSAKTEIDFVVESKGENTDTAIVGEKGKITLKIINQGLGEIKFVSVQIFPSGFELTSSEKIYIGTIDSDDSDFATFDVIFKSKNPTLSAKVDYKDFDNGDQSETVNLPVKVYTREKALELGLIKNPNYTPYGIGGIVIVGWIVWRKIKKRRKNKGRKW